MRWSRGGKRDAVRGMRPRGAVALVAAGMLAGSLSCTSVVAGTPTAAPPSVPALTGARTSATPTPTSGPPAPPESAPGPRGTLAADPQPDECLLNAAEAGALVGTAVRPPQQDDVARPDGSTGSSCVATAGGEPVVQLNVYRVRGGTPADYVRTAPMSGRALEGAGEAAAVFDTPAGPTLQVAGPEHLVTVLVVGTTPTDDAWRTAATAATSRLPR